MAFTSMKQKRSGSRQRIKGDLIYSVQKNGHNADGSKRYGCNWRLSPELLMQAGLSNGDHVDILIDYDDRTGMIVKDDRGWALSKQGGAQNRHTYPACSVQITMDDNLPNIDEPTPCDVVAVRNHEILFAFPENTVFKVNGAKIPEVQHAIGI